MKNTAAETLKLATVFIPAYTAESNYARCLEAGKAASGSPYNEAQRRILAESNIVND
jgi:hypothetical protein